MAGYTRQAAANISNGNVADADDIDLELDALAAAFSGVSGHLHDGSTGNGPKISSLAGTVGLELSDSGSTIGPTLNLDRLSASPAANDFIGNIDFRGNDSVGNLDTYARIYTVITNPTSGAEISTLTFDTISGGVLATGFEIGTTANFYVAAVPGVDNGVALGSTSLKWADLFLADGGVINFGNGSATINESADSLLYNVTGSGQHVFGGGTVRPVSNDGGALGTATTSWSDLFLASGGVINFGNGGHVISQNGTQLLFTTGSSGAAFTNGITFTAESSNGSALDYYEESIWTPEVEGTTAAGIGTYSTQNGTYTRIGRVVFIEIDVTWTAHTGTGNMRIRNLPFAATVNNGNIWAAPGAVNIATAGPYCARMGSGQKLELFSTGTGNLIALPIDSAATFRVSGFYFV